MGRDARPERPGRRLASPRAWLRRARLVAGLILLTYLTTHYLNHALGLVSLSAMEAGRSAFLALWRNPPGSLALYGAVVTHFALALTALWQRRTWRMPGWEWLRLILGLSIPPLIAGHFVGTRLAHAWFDTADSYTRVVLNRYFETVGTAIERAGGIPTQFTGDGVMALFGVDTGPEEGCRRAVAAGQAMLGELARLSRTLADEVGEPLRMGVGIHTGPAVVGRMGYAGAVHLAAVGDTVHVAARFQELTKQYGCQMVISEQVATRAGLDVAGHPRHEIRVRNRREPLVIRVVADAARLGLVVLAVVLGMVGGSPVPAEAVEPRFDLVKPADGPFPSDRLTVPDPTQRTGIRVDLPLPDCTVARSTCDEVRLLNELDGFDLAPRLAIPFDGPIDVATVTPRSLFLIRLAAGPPEAVGVGRLVWDPASSTLYAWPGALLEPETRYGLVVTRAIRDKIGRPLRPALAFRRLLTGTGPAASRPHRLALQALMVALRRRGLSADDVVVASTFTTGSVTTFLERVREALDQQLPPAASLADTTGGAGAYFSRAALAALHLWRQVRPSEDGGESGPVPGPPEPPVPPGVELVPPPGVRASPLPLAALPRDAVGALAVGWYQAPAFLTPARRIVEGPTGRRPGPAPAQAALPFVVILPAGLAPPGGWPLALFGHGYGGEMLSGALLVGGTLARHGIATAAVSVVGHGGGPDSRLIAVGADARTQVVRVPGRGLDVDGDGVIGDTEGLAPAGSLAALGLRDGLRQQVVDLLALVRALRDGFDADGDGYRDVRAPAFYLGHSLGGIYGALFLAVEPRLRVGVLNGLGGPVSEIARLSPVFRPLLRDTLRARTPSLLNAGSDFREDLPAREEPPMTDPATGAVAVQAFLARVEWLGRRGDPVAAARYLREAPVPGLGPARVLIQFAAGDGVVPNVTTRTFLRAGGLGDAASILRADRLAAATGGTAPEPHGFLLRVRAPGLVGRVARAVQSQAARFFLGEEATVSAAPGDAPLPDGLFEERP